MDANKYLTADWLDIIFDGKNKTYGAYDLRKTYTKRLVTALAIVFSVVLALTAFVYAKAKFGTTKTTIKEVVMTKTVNLPKVKKPDPPKPKEEKPKPKEKKPEPKKELAKPKNKPIEEAPVKLATIKKTDIKIVETPKEENKVAKLKDLDDKQIATFSQAGMKTNVNTGFALKTDKEGTGFGGGGGTGSDASGTDDKTIYSDVQQEAAYPGDWKKFLERSLNQEVPSDNGAPEGSVLRVIVSFVVDKEGNVSEAKIANAPNPDYGTANEALRAIKRSGKWTPAMQNGRKVISRRTQPIVFQVQGG